MRIVHGIFTAGYFGSERYAVDLADRQARLGHEVHLLIRPTSAIGKRDITATVHEVGDLARLFGMGGVIARLKPDVLHAHLGKASAAFAPLKTPAVATLHIDYRPIRHARLDGLIALTGAQRDRALARGYRGVIEAIPNALPALPPAGPADREVVRRELGVAADDFVVGFCGRLHEVKDPLLLVRAFKAAWRPGMILALAGEGKLRGEIEALAAGDGAIRVLGYRGDTARLYQAFDHFVVPSREEPFGLVLLEAMQAGLPIAATRTEGPSGVLPVPPATLFDPGDEAALTAILRHAADTRPRRLAYDLSAFDPLRQTEKILAFYERIRS